MFSDNAREPIAIIGIGCRFPGAPNPKAFWELLREGRDAIREVPSDRWDANAFCDANPKTPGKTVNCQGGFIENVDQFDWRAFRIPPREAKYMDPQQRLLLEVAWEALEDAGLPFEKVAGSQTGVFVGIMWNDYLRLQSVNFSELNGYSNTGGANAFGPNRISYAFGLKGPSVAIDSACASSLTSIHLACQSLWLEESSLALAGGVNIMLLPDISIMLSKAGLISPEGRCATLDAKADGFVRGEGAGLVVLKPFSRLTPSDRIYAVIRGSAINHNGHNEWIMAANPDAQELVIRDACRRFGIHPAEIDYVELHGTGLLKGDALEANVLGKVVGRHKARNFPCSIGSVKTNIGHLESAAGIAGIIKVALSLYHGQIPPTLHYQDINPDVDLVSLGLTVQNKLGPWPVKSGPNLAGVTAIAMSGVNAHVVLEGPSPNSNDDTRVGQAGPPKAHLLLLSARTPEALLVLAHDFKDLLNNEGSEAPLSLENICYTAAVRRSHHEYRLALVSRFRENLVENIEAFLQGQEAVGVFKGRQVASDQDMLDRLKKEGLRTDLISECLQHRDRHGTVCVSLPLGRENRLTGVETLAMLYAYGYNVDWRALYPDEAQCAQLPVYPWQRERLWLDWLDNPASRYPLKPSKPPDESFRTDRNEVLSELKDAQPIHRRSLLLVFIRDQVLKILGLDSSYPLKPQDRLFEVGLDSIGAVDLTNNLQASLEHKFPSTLIFDYPTVESLCEYISKEVLCFKPNTIFTAESGKTINDDESIDLETVKRLTEDEAEELLLKKLEAVERNLK